MLAITSLQNPTVKLIRSLTDKKARREHGLFVAEGLQMMERAIAEGWEPQHLIATKTIALWDTVRPTLVSPEVMAALSQQNNPHDVLATFKLRFERSLAFAEAGATLALEEIRDPGNLGTILRTADAAGIAAVILIGDCCDAYSPECVRASTGSIFASSIKLVPTAEFIAMCKEWHGDVVGTEMAATQDYRRRYKEPTLLVLGSEARGLSPAVSKACTELVRIPMRKGVESLNVATAAALMMYHAARFD
jgi:RNA methyltransferase, TrmH family